MIEPVHKERTSRQQRRRWEVCGQVQGVGFRPFVFRLATSCRLSGFVRNIAGRVTIEAQGRPSDLRNFDRSLVDEAPPLAVVHSVRRSNLTPLAAASAFFIAKSTEGDLHDAAATVDAAVCDDCVAELLSATDRRAGYGLINCTNCGPRYTILRKLPYDRPTTTMAGFALCDTCGREYAEPSDRRFHAQATACRECGPTLQLASPHGDPLPGDPIAAAAKLLRAGGIVAIKGIGGFHLAVRADDESAVARLRRLKHRDAKPFALLVGSLAAARDLVELSPAGQSFLTSPRRPIVLAPQKPGLCVAASVAPGVHRLGVMLPYTPIHHLLFAALTDVSALVMTSGNLSDEPLATDNAEAVARLSAMCDAMLWHDRSIHRSVDDSVAIDFFGGPPLFLRRARGFVPQAIPLPAQWTKQFELPAGLCVGGELKNTIAVVRGGEAILSQHLGDLKHPAAYQQFEQTCDDMMQLFGVSPEWVACDLHPSYLSTQYAQAVARRRGIPLLQVQHHHAHAAAAMVEHQCPGPVLALVCDGVGYGSDGGVWGGELLLAELASFQRVASLSPLRLVGGDAAARDPRRSGLAMLARLPELRDSLVDHPLVQSWIPSRTDRTFLVESLRRGVGCVDTSAAGRWFDGAAALLGVCLANDYESQAPQQLESLAAEYARTHGDLDAEGGRDDWSFQIVTDPGDSQLLRLDLNSAIRRLLDGTGRGEVAGALAFGFHRDFAAAWEAIVAQAVAATGVETIALTGGVFCNELLTRLLTRRLQRRGLRVLRHEKVSPNDSGLALGQAAVAAARLASEVRPSINNRSVACV